MWHTRLSSPTISAFEFVANLSFCRENCFCHAVSTTVFAGHLFLTQQTMSAVFFLPLCFLFIGNHTVLYVRSRRQIGLNFGRTGECRTILMGVGSQLLDFVMWWLRSYFCFNLKRSIYIVAYPLYKSISMRGIIHL